MTFTTKSIFAGIALFSVALVVSPLLSAIHALYVVLAIGSVLALCFRKVRRRCFVYGALGGIVSGLVLVSAIVELRYRDLPDVPLPLGRVTQRPAIVAYSLKTGLPYGITLGFVFGGLSGLVASDSFSNPESAVAQLP